MLVSKTNLQPISVYVHWPFCLSKCPYCDFNSHVRENTNDVEMTTALLKEVDHYAAMVGERQLKSIFFGGGTPSLMPASTVEAVINRLSGYFNVSSDIEITLEANPTSVEAGKFSDFSAAGVNRVSLGIQALNDADLKALGREHSVKEAKQAIVLSQKYFTRSNFDLIYARMGQVTSDWEKELKEAFKMANGHLSLYQLTIEKGTPFYGRYNKGDLIIPNEDQSAELYDLTNNICADYNYPAYEISNYAKVGEESRHNLTYWKYDDYIGVGAGAHGRITIGNKTFATEQNKKPETWLKAVEKNGHATKHKDLLNQQMMSEEMIMMGLRLTDGIDHNQFKRRIGADIKEFIAKDRLEHLISQGFLTVDPLQLTAKGRPLLNQILGQILV
ncbi:MAG: coproporphyrinogen III oxidase [Kordiimonadaceae bacterium]|jgi:putative oxygen-independent coproporphyrinogen III oxidase|nr:coproporphyrinogen III oxidase [Kordiimonadaceae bacterium]MBT6033705.1 coproporphyrinogen III oxidase [Kordiimonadaceae bacterium]